MCSISPTDTQEYWVVFTDSTAGNWMVRMLKAPFQHVYAIKKSEGGYFWIEINPRCAATDITTHLVSDYPHIRMLVKPDDVVLHVKCVIKEQERWTLCIINCVEVVKSLMGIRSFWTFTPWQLYRYLLEEKTDG